MINLPKSKLIYCEFQTSNLSYNSCDSGFLNTNNIISISLTKHNVNIMDVDVKSPCLYLIWRGEGWGYLTQESSYNLNKELGLGFKEFETLILE